MPRKAESGIRFPLPELLSNNVDQSATKFVDATVWKMLFYICKKLDIDATPFKIEKNKELDALGLMGGINQDKKEATVLLSSSALRKMFLLVDYLLRVDPEQGPLSVKEELIRRKVLGHLSLHIISFFITLSHEIAHRKQFLENPASYRKSIEATMRYLLANDIRKYEEDPGEREVRELTTQCLIALGEELRKERGKNNLESLIFKYIKKTIEQNQPK